MLPQDGPIQDIGAGCSDDRESACKRYIRCPSDTWTSIDLLQGLVSPYLSCNHRHYIINIQNNLICMHTVYKGMERKDEHRQTVPFGWESRNSTNLVPVLNWISSVILISCWPNGDVNVICVTLRLVRNMQLVMEAMKPFKGKAI